MNAYTVVGPTNFHPSFFSAFDRAIDSADVATICGGPWSLGS